MGVPDERRLPFFMHQTTFLNLSSVRCTCGLPKESKGQILKSLKDN